MRAGREGNCNTFSTKTSIQGSKNVIDKTMLKSQANLEADMDIKKFHEFHYTYSVKQYKNFKEVLFIPQNIIGILFKYPTFFMHNIFEK